MAPPLGSNDVVVLSTESLESADIRATIVLNIDFVNALFKELLTPEEVSHDALLSYYVDYYLAQVNNGGFAQFVYNTGWKQSVVALVKEGLSTIGATKHAELFEKCDWLVAKQASKLSRFLASAFFGKNTDRDRFNAINEQFSSLEKTESLERLNAAWLKSRPGLCTVPASGLQAEIEKRASRISDRDSRLAKARAAEPIYVKRIRALCEAAGHTLQKVTAGDPTNEYNGRRILAWHFITDKGHHFMVEADGRAMMFQGKTKEQVAELNLG